MQKFMRISYLLSYPLFMDKGGGVTQAYECLGALKELGYSISPLNWFSEEIDFDILFLFGFTHFNPQILRYLKDRGKKIILEPIFVRTTNFISNILAKPLKYFPLANTVKVQYQILELSDLIFPNSEVEKNEISLFYGIPKEKMFVAHLGLPSYVKELESKVSEDLFFSRYGVKDFVFYPSARISIRKNQLNLIKALKGSGLKLVLTGCNDIDKEIEKEFKELVSNDKDILCLEVLDKEMLISAYKNARVLAFVSLAETAGIIGIEGGYLGNTLVLSDIKIFREYFREFGIYVNNKDPKDIRRKIFKAMDGYRNDELRHYIEDSLTWRNHAKVIDEQLKKL